MQMLPTPRDGGEEKAETVIKRKGKAAAAKHNLLAAVQMLPTPKVHDAHGWNKLGRTDKNGKPFSPNLADLAAAKMLPTPQAGDGEGGGHKVSGLRRDDGRSSMLKDLGASGMLPSPKSRDWKGQTQRGTHAPGDGLCNALDCTGSQLMPEFVEWMMGFEEGYTDVVNPDTGKPIGRKARLKMLGNAIVPQVAMELIGFIKDIEVKQEI